MNQKLFFILDQGTSVHKLLVFDQHGDIIDTFSASAPESFQHADGLGFRGDQLRQISNDLIARAIHRYEKQLVAFGFSNQGESVLFWDRDSGKALTDVMSWQCQAADGYLHRQAQNFARIREISGLVPSAYFSAAKLGAALERHPELHQQLHAGRVCVGTLDAWMISGWTRTQRFVTDPTTACRTQLYDVTHGGWSDELLDYFGLNRISLPEIIPNDTFEILCDEGPFKRRALPLLASFCDQPASLIGHGGLENAILKVTLGTGAFVDLSCRATSGSSRLLKSVLYAASGQPAQIYLEGGVLSFGSAIAWLENQLKVSRKVFFDALYQFTDLKVLPAFSGLGAPHFRSQQRTVVSGMDLAADAVTLAAATVQGLVFRIAEIVNAMSLEENLPDRILVDGGVSQDTVLMQFMADVLQKAVVVQDQPEITSLGVARVVRQRLGMESQKQNTPQKIYQPSDVRVQEQYRQWCAWTKAILQ